MSKNITLKAIKTADLRPLWEIAFGSKADLKWMKTNGPYFQDPIYDWPEFSEHAKNWVDNPHWAAIVVDDRLVGIVSAVWEDGDLRRWLEFGIAIYDANLQGKGVGTVAVKLWLAQLFALYPELPHLGFTTFSGNPAMMKLGERLGMQQEARIRQVRFWQNEWFDSVKYGILREEWENLKIK